MNFLEKIQNLPEGKRKFILWILVIIVGILLLFLYINNVKRRIGSFDKEGFKEGLNLPGLTEELNKLPKIEMPEIKVPSTTTEVTTETATTEQGLLENQ